MQYPLKRIAYLDDDKNLRFLLKESLERKRPNCEVILFEKAEDLLLYLQSTTPDLLIVDYSLPDISGIEFLKIVRTMPEPATHIPALILSGLSEHDMHNIRETENLIGILKKPFTLLSINNDIDFLWREYHA